MDESSRELPAQKRRQRRFPRLDVGFSLVGPRPTLTPVLLFVWIVASGLAPPWRAFAQVNFPNIGQQLGNTESTAVAVADLDGDGDLDAVVSLSNGDARVWVNQGAAQGGLLGDFALGPHLVGLSARDLAVGDMNNDGAVDVLLLTEQQTNSAKVYLNRGVAGSGIPGPFELSELQNSVAMPCGGALGDLDGDRDLDAFVGGSAQQPARVLLNNGFGGLVDSGQRLTAADCAGLVLGDLDDDGDLDALMATVASPLWFNQGGRQQGTEGNFASAPLPLETTRVTAAALGDADGDGDLDAFIATGAAVNLLVNSGGAQGGPPGGFSTGQVLFTEGGDVLHIAAADFDNDTDLDLYLTKDGADEVWLNNRADGGLQVAQFSDSLVRLGDAFSVDAAAGDFDGNGFSDLFTANAGAPDEVRLSNTTAVTSVNPIGWQAQIVTARGRTGVLPVVAVDATDNIHVAHSSSAPGTANFLTYSYWDGVYWTHTTLHSSRGFAGFDMALDGGNRPHVVVTQSNPVEGVPSEVRYLWFDGTVWQTETVAQNQPSDRLRAAIDVDGNDQPAIAFVRRSNQQGHLNVATRSAQAWTIERVDGNNWRNVDLAIDTGDQWHLVAVDGPTDNIYTLDHVERVDGVWTRHPLASGFAADYRMSIAAASAPMISYANPEITLATRANGIWTSELVSGLTTERTDLVIQQNGVPQIAFANRNTLYLATPAAPFWLVRSIDPDDSASKWPSLALDAQGQPTLAYFDERYEDLRVSSLAPRWQETVVLSRSVQSPSIAVSSGQPVMGFFDFELSSVFSALRTPNQWTGQGVAPSAMAVGDVSIARDPSTNTAISFRDTSANRLMLATGNAIASWQLRVVDDTADVGLGNRILFSTVGNLSALIAYWDGTNGQLKLARQALAGMPPPVLTANTLTPAGIDVTSAPLAAGSLRENMVAISYFDTQAQSLRLATVDAQDVWTDDLLYAGSGSVSAPHDLAIDTIENQPTVALHDPALNAIVFGTRSAGGWSFETALTGVGRVAAIRLALASDTATRPRVSFVDPDQLAIRHISRRDGRWENETIRTYTGTGTPGLAAASSDRSHLLVSALSQDLRYIQRTASVDQSLTAPLATTPPPPPYDPVAACLSIFNALVGGEGAKQGLLPAGTAGSLPDDLVYRGLYDTYQQSAGGRHYVELYRKHAVEMSQIVLTDAQLRMDVYGLLQRMLPGLESLVQGGGEDVLMSADDMLAALSVWQRLAAAAGPELRAAIERELGTYADLNAFVELTYSQGLSLIQDRGLFSDSFE